MSHMVCWKVGVIRPISRELDNRPLNDNVHLVSNLNKVNNNRNVNANSNNNNRKQEKETLIIEKDSVHVPVVSWNENTQVTSPIVIIVNLASSIFLRLLDAKTKTDARHD